MEVFHKFYTRLLPIAEKAARDKQLPEEAAGAIMRVAREMILEATQIYTCDILKDKFELNIDLSDKHRSQTEEEMERYNPEPYFKQNVTPCEICGNPRVPQKCHIIPRNIGGFDEPGNIVVLCANHHWLFDRHKLTSDEWACLKWDLKDIRAKEYALEIRYKMHVMYWKYNYPCIVSCTCGNEEFEIVYEERNPVIRDGGVEVYPGQVIKKLICRKCGDYYHDAIFKDREYEWWRQYIMAVKDEV